MRILAVLLIVLVCAAAVPVPQFVPRPLFVPRPATLPAPALVRATAGQSFVPIGGDARSVPPQSSGVGSAAGMAVTTPACSPGSHLGKPPQTADAGVLTTEPPKGRWETRTVNCGPFGQQRSSGRFTKEIQVWVDGLLPAVASSCPGGVCPGHR